MRHKSMQYDICPIARSLDAIGESWSLLIIRDAMLGARRFSDFQRRLGMARNILTTRLKRLVAFGILETVPASDGSAYLAYVLTEKGTALLPALIALRQWGENYLVSPGEEITALIDKKTRKPLAPLQMLNSDGHPCGISDLELITVVAEPRLKAARHQPQASAKSKAHAR